MNRFDEPSASSIDEGIESAAQLNSNSSTSTALSHSPPYLKLLSRSYNDLTCLDNSDSLSSRVHTTVVGVNRLVDRNGYEIPIDSKIRVTAGRVNKCQGDVSGLKTPLTFSYSLDDSALVYNSCPPPTYSELFAPTLSSSSVKQMEARTQMYLHHKQASYDDRGTQGGCLCIRPRRSAFRQ